MQGIPTIHHRTLSPAPKFSAYRVDHEGVRFVLPGREPERGAQMFLEYMHAGENKSQTKPLTWNGQQWELSQESNATLSKKLANTGIYYRFVDHRGTPILDNNYTQHIQNKTWNYIPKGSADPSSTGATLLVFRDSLVTPAQLDQYQRLRNDHGDDIQSKRNHYNRLGGTYASNDFLRELYKSYGIKIVEDRPLIGGDMLSAHGYWTNSLFQPNGIISKPSGFEKLALVNLEDGARMCFDGAFVNEGFNGIHYLSNLYYGDASPFLHWFDYGKLNQFPYQPLQLGVLPIKTGDIPNEKAWDIRFRDSNGDMLQPFAKTDFEGPFFVELYDPRLEDANGRKYTPEVVRQNFARENKDPILTNSQESVQNYRFPISRQEYVDKINALQQASRIPIPAEKAKALQQLKTQWKQFQFTASSLDNSAYNWDGQRDVKKLNIAHPDVTAYVKEACTYWTDKIDRIYTSHVAKTLGTAFARENDWMAAVKSITKDNLQDSRPERIMPSLNGGEEWPISAQSIQNALSRYQKAKSAQRLPASANAARELRENFQLSTLPAPPMLQIVFNTPRLKELIKYGEAPKWLEVTTALFQPIFNGLDKLLPRYKPFKKLVNWLNTRFGNSFIKVLQQKLESSLSPALKEKLKDPVLGHLFYEQMGQSIYLSLLTGKFIPPTAGDKELDANTLAHQYSQHIPPYILTAISKGNPTLAAELMNRFLIEKLKGFNTQQLNAPLETLLGNITPTAAVVARHALQERRLGLHWRIDAMKDMGDMDGVRGEEELLKTNRLTQEIYKVKRIMMEISNGIRSVFDKTILKGEITDLGGLSTHEHTSDEAENRKNNEAPGKLLAHLMEGKTLDGMPNYTWLYATGHKAMGIAQQPDMEGENQLTVPDFVQNKLKPMMNELPLYKVMMYQNMTSNHDMSTSLYSLVLNPMAARVDYQKWLGLNHKDGYGGDWTGLLYLAANELHHKPQVGFLKGNLPDWCFHNLKNLSSKNEILFDIYNDNNLRLKVAPYMKGNDNRKGAIPIESKLLYIDTIFKHITPQELGVTPQQKESMKTAMKQLIAEPSEVKAMRGKLSNVFRDIKAADVNQLATVLGNTTHASKVREALDAIPVATMDKTLWTLGQKMGRAFGYQQIDYIVGWAINEIAKTTDKLNDKTTRDALKQAFFNATIQPALEQYKRIVAMQIATPGDPTLYLPDLLGQVGGEDTKNMYIGNRELIRHDWLKTNPVIHQYFNELGEIVRLRNDYHVLNNGHLELPLDPARLPEKDGQRHNFAEDMKNKAILPLIRDNGTDQAICLVNFSRPKDAYNSWMDHQENDKFRERYPEVTLEQKDYQNYFLDLKQIRIPKNTVYRSVDAEGKGEEYIVNNDYKLVRRDNPDRGINIKVARTLIRVGKA